MRCYAAAGETRTTAAQARNESVDRLRDLSQPRRHATLVCFLWQSYHDAIDQLIDMFDKILARTQRQAGYLLVVPVRWRAAVVPEPLRIPSPLVVEESSLAYERDE